jgi:hypothetical protein
MAASVLVACIVFLNFLLPCFSNSCPTTTLPCSPSIQIKPPFYFQLDNESDGPSCGGNLIRIRCDKNDKAFLELWDSYKIFPLEKISYGPNIITIQDLELSNSLKQSDCDNICFNFSSTPINHFNDKTYDSLNTSLSSVRCDPPNRIPPPPPEILGKGYNQCYAPPSLDENDEPPPDCFRLEHTFELNLLFREDSKELTLQWATYYSSPSCFPNSTETSHCEGCKKGHLCFQQLHYFIDTFLNSDITPTTFNLNFTVHFLYQLSFILRFCTLVI